MFADGSASKDFVIRPEARSTMLTVEVLAAVLLLMPSSTTAIERPSGEAEKLG